MAEVTPAKGELAEEGAGDGMNPGERYHGEAPTTGSTTGSTTAASAALTAAETSPLNARIAKKYAQGRAYLHMPLRVRKM